MRVAECLKSSSLRVRLATVQARAESGGFPAAVEGCGRTLESGAPLEPALLEQMRLALSARYGVVFEAVGFNLYRDGRDSVAWHRDHILKQIREPVIALVSLGERRKFLMRPYGGGPSRSFLLGRGDLLVTGGLTNRDWEHAVPKVPQAGPRISLAFRYGMDLRAYAHKQRVEPDR